MKLHPRTYVPRCQVCGDRMAPRKQAPFLCPDCSRQEVASCTKTSTKRTQHPSGLTLL